MQRHVFVSFSCFLTFVICANQLYIPPLLYFKYYIHFFRAFRERDAELHFHFHRNITGIMHKIAITIPHAISWIALFGVT